MVRGDQRFREQIIRAGIATTFVLSACAAVYLLRTWDEPHRPLMLAIVGLAVLDGSVIALIPRRHLTSAAVYERLIVCWQLAHIVFSGVLYHLDGAEGPFLTIFLISVAFAGGALSHVMVLVVAALNVFVLAGIWALHGHAHDGTALWAGALVVLAGLCVTIATHREQRDTALNEAREDSLRRLARVVEYRDSDTGGHIERMAQYVFVIAQAMKLSPELCRQLRLASTMHDIGKVAVPDAVLLKPGRLTPEERAVMETHAQVGHDMLADSGSDVLELAATIALTHHERYDGAGYPNGIAGTDIPLAGRIVAVADVFDAVTSKRVYKEAAEVETAVAVIAEGRGTQFDPRVVDAFLSAQDQIAAVRREWDPAPEAPAAGTPRLPAQRELAPAA